MTYPGALALTALIFVVLSVVLAISTDFGSRHWIELKTILGWLFLGLGMICLGVSIWWEATP